MGWAEDIDNIIAAEKITFIGYYIGVYESIQKFIGLITNAVRAQKKIPSYHWIGYYLCSFVSNKLLTLSTIVSELLGFVANSSAP
jgi:hypothetical protein